MKITVVYEITGKAKASQDVFAVLDGPLRTGAHATNAQLLAEGHKLRIVNIIPLLARKSK